ncbi:P-type DNA transfer protein VirB5 (plasmid) [Pseudomonas aeruginosa]|uniref:P-type DNA transfer protein VirB5 n=1 Tax=Pseudomonas aeruginosa TaxID=287 RepID=UPI00070A092C|nr:P-type DNA transfer protein VirB5 [Pseudomonas aeruginosa]UGR47973.1 P-type DNA transfer protein VirB5 [Pseudomonas aeruginosa]
MKKTLLAAALAAVTVTAAPLIQAIGIPTLDAATVLQLGMNAKQQAEEALKALNEAKRGIEQARQQYEHYKSLINGNDKLGGFLNDPTLNQVLPLGDWADVYSSARDMASLRNRYGLVSSDGRVQAQFDKLLAVTDALERNYKASNQRVENAARLREQLDQVQTPQQKQDLELRYQQEFLELQNQQMRLANMKVLTEQKERIESDKRAQEVMDYLNGKRPLPK